MITREKILNTPAGKELDALVAEYVLGWQRDTSDVGNYFNFWLTGSSIQTESKVALTSYPFSTDIKISWRFVESFNLIIGIDIEQTDPNNKWCASLEWIDYKKSLFSAWAPTAPLAICRSILLLSTTT
jgi:hypothetical protein